MFREYGKLSGGSLPDSLDFPAVMQAVGKSIGKKLALQTLHEKFAAEKRKLSEEQIRKLDKLMDKFMDWQLNPAKRPNEEEMRKTEDEMRKIVDWKRLGEGRLSEAEVRKLAQAEAKKAAEAGAQETVKVQMPLQRGIMFAMMPAEADAHYAGKGVSLGAAATPIFWYRPKDAQKFRVIYADLSVRDADSAPNQIGSIPVRGN